MKFFLIIIFISSNYIYSSTTNKICLSNIIWATYSGQFSNPRFPYIIENPRNISLQDLQTEYLNHIRVYDGQFEILIPNENGSFKIVKTKSKKKALELVKNINNPIALETMIENSKTRLNSIMAELYEIDVAPGVILSGRIKKLDSAIEKIFRLVKTHGDKFDIKNMDDLVATRFITKTKKQIQEIQKKILKKYGNDSVIVEIKNKDAGYQAVHLTVKNSSGDLFEVQLMTERMSNWDAWNHDLIYKSPYSKGIGKYREKLTRYSSAVAKYLNALDQGRTIPIKPDYRNFDIIPEEQFIFE